MKLGLYKMFFVFNGHNSSNVMKFHVHGFHGYFITLELLCPFKQFMDVYGDTMEDNIIRYSSNVHGFQGGKWM